MIILSLFLILGAACSTAMPPDPPFSAAQNEPSDSGHAGVVIGPHGLPITGFEAVSNNEEALIDHMIDLLEKQIMEDYPAGEAKRGAHAKTLACLHAEFSVMPDLPDDMKVGLFAEPGVYPAWVRISSASGTIQPDKVKDLRGFAIKIMGVQGERFQSFNRETQTQDFILLSHPTMPLGTVKLFHDAVSDSLNWSPLIFAARLVLTGRFHVLNDLRKAVKNQTSPLNIPYWSTTPYLFGPDRCVKYALIPTSAIASILPPKLTDHYLTDAMEKQLTDHELQFDFMIQIQTDPERMPVEDAGRAWSEDLSPPIKVGTLRIPPQVFRTPEREAFAENLSFSPAHSLVDHRPIGGINRARTILYHHLSEFRHIRNDKLQFEPRP